MQRMTSLRYMCIPIADANWIMNLNTLITEDICEPKSHLADIALFHNLNAA